MTINFSGKTCLITGATSGLGRSFALQLAGVGASLILIGRNEEPLQQFSTECRNMGAISVNPITCDLGRIDEIEQVLTTELSSVTNIYLIVHCAAINRYRTVATEPKENILNAFLATSYSFTRIVQVCIQKFKTDQGGFIIIPSSGNAYIGTTGQALYSANKAYVQRMAESLSQELQPLNIQIKIVQPGPFKGKCFVSRDKSNQNTSQTLRNSDEIARLILSKLNNESVFINLTFKIYIIRILALLSPRFLLKIANR